MGTYHPRISGTTSAIEPKTSCQDMIHQKSVMGKIDGLARKICRFFALSVFNSREC